MEESRGSFDSTPKFRLVIAWGFVGIPLIWGVTQTFIKALALFE